MSERIAFRAMSLILLAATLAIGPACAWLDNLAAPGADALTAPEFSVTLRIVNQSGVPAEVVVGYQLGQMATRDTTRLLAADGVAAEEIVIRTRAETITATARVSAGLPALSARIQIGDVIAQREYRYGTDYQAGDTVEFFIPALGPGPDPLADCNANGVFDTTDLAAGTSLDRNGNEIPDECDIAAGTSADQNHNGVPDEVERRACCLGDGSCMDEIVEQCASLGGSPGGVGSKCAATPCTSQPAEACCFTSGICQNLSPSACSSQGGVPKGAGTTCSAMECPVSLPTVACCFAGPSCSDLTMSDCLTLNGTPLQTGSNCQTTTCPADQTEACCIPVSGCFQVTPSTCEQWGGMPQGSGTTCLTVICTPG
jgi:hypothetical protein